MHPRSKKLLEDMRDAAANIAEFADGQTLQGYLASRQLRYAVERCFEILGEALSQLNKIDPQTATKIRE
jgi:uncharacterized protein with HEPN domain